MNVTPTNLQRGRMLCCLLSLALSHPLHAQVTDDNPPTGGSPDKKFVTLSPFVVNSIQDTGYQATSTLAGTRLNTPVKDLAASISIYTKDFLNDIGATNSTDLLVYATGMEAAGMGGGNFSGATNDIGAERTSGESVRTKPQSATRTRGLAAPSFTRGYFSTSLEFDSYNTTTVTVNRGPNAILFGVGSAAGIVDTALASSDLNQDGNKITLRYGNNDAMRVSADFNRVLIPRKLATRLILLQDNERFNQRPAFEDKQRIYGTFTFEPYRSTSFRGNFESGHSRANRPISLLPFDSASSQWYAAGRPAFDWQLYDNPALNPNAASQEGGSAAFPEPITIGVHNVFGPMFVYNNPTDSGPANGFLHTVPNTSGTVANAIRSQVVNSIVNRDGAPDTIRFLTTLNQWSLPAAYWTGSRVPAGQQPGFVPAGMKAQSFRDYSAFDWRNRMIDETGRQNESFHTFNLAFSQSAWEDRVGIEVAYDRQRVDRNSKNSFFSGAFFNAQHIYVDATVSLPNGQPNPNLGRPFALFGQQSWSRSFEDRETTRATAFLRYDFKDLGRSFGKWLGRHTLTGIYENNGVKNVSYDYRLAVQGAASEAANPGNILASLRRPSILVYMGPSVIGNTNPLTLQPIQIPEISAGATVPVSYFVRAADATDPGRFEKATTTLVDLNNGGGATREVIKSQAVVLQSYWLQEHLITTLGWRRDEDFFVRKAISYVANPNDKNDPGKVHYNLDDFPFPRTPPFNVAKEIKSFGAVLRWPEKLVRLPAGIQFSVFANKSENFTPLGGRVNAFGEGQGSPSGKTTEYGLNLALFREKLNLRVNRFETGAERATSTPSFYGNSVLNTTLQIAAGWAQEGNRNPQLSAQRNADIELLFSKLPANFRQMYGYKVSGTAPNIAASVNTAAFPSGDTTDYNAEGVEFELTYNPTRNWRIMANVAKQETIQANAYPFLKRFVELMKPVWDQLSNRPSGSYPDGFQPGDTLPPSTQTYGQYLDANVYVPLSSALASEGVASAEQRKWRVNIITNYSFGPDSLFGSKLRGVGIGGAVRWQDKLGLGYPSSRQANGTVDFDLARPYYAPAETNVDAWLSYERKLPRGKIHWKVQLNVTNLNANNDLVGLNVQSWSGEIAQYRIPAERRWFLTNTFTF